MRVSGPQRTCSPARVARNGITRSVIAGQPPGRFRSKSQRLLPAVGREDAIADEESRLAIVRAGRPPSRGFARVQIGRNHAWSLTRRFSAGKWARTECRAGLAGTATPPPSWLIPCRPGQAAMANRPYSREERLKIGGNVRHDAAAVNR
jgi:hypothetical protein